MGQLQTVTANTEYRVLSAPSVVMFSLFWSLSWLVVFRFCTCLQLMSGPLCSAHVWFCFSVSLNDSRHRKVTWTYNCCTVSCFAIGISCPYIVAFIQCYVLCWLWVILCWLCMSALPMNDVCCKICLHLLLQPLPWLLCRFTGSSVLVCRQIACLHCSTLVRAWKRYRTSPSHFLAVTTCRKRRLNQRSFVCCVLHCLLFWDVFSLCIVSFVKEERKRCLLYIYSTLSKYISDIYVDGLCIKA